VDGQAGFAPVSGGGASESGYHRVETGNTEMRNLGLIGLFCRLLFPAGGLPAEAPIRWAVYYSDRAGIEELLGYDLLIFDSDTHPPLQPLLTRNKTLLGYLSLGEAEDYRPYFAEVKADGILLDENQNWKGSHLIDLRDERWVRRVVHQIIPGIVQQGFNGLFLDTLDNAIELERRDPLKFAGMKSAAVALVSAIRAQHPGLKLMVNRGYELLPLLARHVEMVLGESVFATYDFAAKKYRPTPRDEYLEQIRLLNEARQRRPELMVFTLDYWNPEDAAGIRRIYRTERVNGFHPYVATIKLDRIVREPQP
jgi:polysaccharide biosynthesis protein PelA